MRTRSGGAETRRNGGRIVRKLAFGRIAAAVIGAAACFAAAIAPAAAATDIAWWHAMSGELGRQLEKLAADFNASQPDYRIVPAY